MGSVAGDEPASTTRMDVCSMFLPDGRTDCDYLVCLRRGGGGARLKVFSKIAMSGDADAGGRERRVASRLSYCWRCWSSRGLSEERNSQSKLHKSIAQCRGENEWTSA